MTLPISKNDSRLTIEPTGMAGLSWIDPNKAFAKSWMFKVLSLSQFESYPKLCILTPRKASSSGSQACGQYSSGLEDLVHVLRDPPPRPCTKIKSATESSSGQKRVFNPNGPFASSSLLFVPPLVKLRPKIDRDAKLSVRFFELRCFSMF